MPGSQDTALLHRGVHPDGRPLTSTEREKLLEPYLPKPRHAQLHAPPSGTASHTTGQGIRLQIPAVSLRSDGIHWLQHLLTVLLHKIIFFAIQFLFSIYIRARQTYNAVFDRIFSVLYYHHRTPELIRRDVKNLGRLPKHLSIIIDLQGEDGYGGVRPEGLAKLVDDVAEISAWCACAGIPFLSLYERTGVLKSHIPSVHNAISSTLRAYFPPSSSPMLCLRAPHHSAYSPPSSPSLSTNSHVASLNVLLLSATDGRDTLVDLTKTLTEMAQRSKIRPSDISAELIDAELTESSCGEPDLLVLMAPSTYKTARGTLKQRNPARRGRRRGAANVDRQGLTIDDFDNGRTSLGAGGDVCLRGYPPWQARLTEIFHVQDNAGVGYQVFLRALHNYAKAQMRFGR